MPTKNEIRKQIRQIRDAYGAKPPVADEICTRLLELDAVRDAKAWFVYVSAGSEVDTHELILTLLARGNTIAVPRVASSEEIVAQQIHAFEELRLSEFGILAPAPAETYQGTIDACVCPGIAFSERGDRLGSGRGYYDRYLAAHPPRLVVGLAFEFQIVPELPSELHDRRMDFIVTEKRVIQFDRTSR
jgi:5-formyltetrahydrofolate cyclo-ligase